MWFFALLLLQVTGSPCAAAESARTDPPTVVVQVVDPSWMPLPGIEVVLTRKKGSREATRTSNDGNAKFWVAQGAEYSVEVKYPGFKTVKMKTVEIGRSTPFATAHVQVRLKVSGPFVEVW
jgi:hypothetical protein